MIEIWNKAKIHKEILHFKNFQTPDISWQEVLNFIFDESKKWNQILKSNMPLEVGTTSGNIEITADLWLSPQNPNLFNKFKGIKELFEKINSSLDSEKCNYYKNELGRQDEYFQCDCKNLWHIQGIRISLGNRIVRSHQDPNRVLYWQILGNSYWKMNDLHTYKLEPGDLLYFNQEDFHEVSQDGPRAGIIIDALNEKI